MRVGKIRTVPVMLPDKPYKVLIGRDLFAKLGDIGEAAKHLTGRRVFVVTDKTVGDIYSKKVAEGLDALGAKVLGWTSFEPGERSKTVTTLTRVWDDLVEAGLERSDMVVALGGGVVGDLAGFAAATYLRGIDFVQLPTTLLAMVDSSVGGKTGVDHRKGKNLLGAFHQPKVVIADLDTLKTLPHREVLSGLAEVIKAAILADEKLFELLEQNGPALVKDPAKLATAVEKAVAVKASVVVEDEKESGKRALLNLGHTFGHALETAGGFTGFNHGEAVAVGMIFAARLSKRLDLIGAEAVARIENLIGNWNYPLDLNGIDKSEVLNALKHDKKRADGKIKWVLPTRIGDARWGCEVDDGLVEQLITEMLPG